MKYKKALIFLTGMPASGKDTQAKLLAKKLKATKITISDLLSDLFNKSSKKIISTFGKTLYLEKEKNKYLSGGLVSPYLVSFLVLKEIEKKLPLKQTLIIVGGPRTVTEAKNYLRFIRHHNLKAIFLSLVISEEEVFKRALKRHRADNLDLPEKVKIRLLNFKKYTLPAINFLKKRKTIEEINGEGSVKEVFNRLWLKIKPLIS